jgi:hypothetical protein
MELEDAFEEVGEPKGDLTCVNPALIRATILNLKQTRVKERPPTLDKDDLGVGLIMKVNTPSMVPLEVIKPGHALREARLFEDLRTI